MKINYVGHNQKEKDYSLIRRPKGSGDYLFLLFITPMKITLNNQIITTKPNACLLYSPDMKQHYTSVNAFENSFIHFSAMSDELVKFSIPINTIFYPEHFVEANNLIHTIRNEYFEKDCYYVENMEICLKKILILLARECKNVFFENSNGKDMKLYDVFKQARMIISIESNRRWTTEKMSKLTHLSKSQFYKYYKEFFGISPKSELINIRIEKAKYLLSNEALTITEISQLVGFENTCHFTRHFKQKCGVSPSGFRHL